MNECQRIHRIELLFAAAPVICFGELLYSGKLSREKTFVIFRVFAIVFFGKFGGLVSLCSTSEQSAKEFSAKIIINNLKKFSPSKVFRYTVCQQIFKHN